MTPTVKAVEIEGASVYGMPQYEYTLEGAEGRLQFCSVATEVSFQQTAAVEAQLQSLAAAVKVRRRKLEDFGNALAAVAWLMPQIKGGKNQKSTDEVKIAWKEGGSDYYALFAKINAIYGLDINIGVKPKWESGKPPPSDPPTEFVMTRGELQKGQAKLEDAVERDNNGMQQEMTTLDGFVAKRDKSFAVAEKVVKKYNSAADNTIRAME